MKKAFYFVGTGFVIGALTATAVYLLKSEKNKECESGNDHKTIGEERTPVDKEILTEAPDVYEEVKSSAIGSMLSRHEDAAAIMRDSIETIRENVKISKDTNDEVDAVSDELDKMLREDQ